MPLRVLVIALVWGGWLSILGATLLAVLATVMPADDWAAIALPVLVAGAGIATGLVLIGFAANLRLIAMLPKRVGQQDRPAQITTSRPE